MLMVTINVSNEKENTSKFSIEVLIQGVHPAKLIIWAEDKVDARKQFNNFYRCNRIVGDFRKIKLEK